MKRKMNRSLNIMMKRSISASPVIRRTTCASPDDLSGQILGQSGDDDDDDVWDWPG